MSEPIKLQARVTVKMCDIPPEVPVERVTQIIASVLYGMKVNGTTKVKPGFVEMVIDGVEVETKAF